MRGPGVGRAQCELVSLHGISAYVPAFRNAEYEPVEPVWSSTLCWHPVNPRDFAASSADGEYETVFRCRDCPGCRNYEDLLLRRRLAQHFRDQHEAVWIVEYESQTLTPAHVSELVAIRSGGEYLPGFFITSLSRIAKLKVGSRPARLTFRGGAIITVHVTRLSRPSSAHAWRSATRGMKIPRSELGAWRKRFYMTGLAPIQDQVFVQQLRGGIRKRHAEARAEARAYRRGLVLYPSDAMIGRTVLARLLAQTSARGARLTINRRRPTAVSALLNLNSENLAKPTGRMNKIPNYSIGNRDAGSPIILTGEFARFAALGTKNPRDG